MKTTFSQTLKREFYRSRTLVFVIFVFCMASVLSFLSTSNMSTSSAADASKFNPGNIISDAVMANYHTMSVSEIQAFLDSKNKCNNTDYNYYLQLTKSQPTIKWHWAGEPYNGHFVCLAEERFGDGEVIGTGMTAAEIIYDAAQVNKINPQVLLVLLQKESSLITDKVPNDFDYRKATGYGCPDTAACDSKYFGFKNQIYRAAELFRYTLDHGSVTFREGHDNYVGYHPNASCGGTKVRIENRATASLYRYTPYQPNSAALNAGYGQGNACSAYGNRNFYLYFTDWFGSTQAAVDGEPIIVPDGTYSLVSIANKKLTISVEDEKVQNGTNVGVLESNSAAPNLNLSRDPVTGYYTISDLQSGKVLDLSNAKTDIDTNIQLWQYDKNTCAQKWKVYQTKDNNLVIETACMPGMVLESIDGNLQLALAGDRKTQQWQTYFGQTLEDGIYNISTDSGLIMQYQEGKNHNGTNTFAAQTNSQNSERWKVSYNTAGDYYVITNASTGRALDLSNARTVNGTNIQLWQYDKNTCAQRWHLLQTPKATGKEFAIISACSRSYMVDAEPSQGNVELHDTEEKLTKWHFTPVKQIIEDGEYRIAASGNAKYMFDVSNGGVKNGTNIQGWSLDSNTGAQKWSIEYHKATDSYIITNPQAGKVLDLSNARTVNGTNIQLWQYDKNTCAQRWIFSMDKEGKYTIHSACNYGYVIDLSNNNHSKNGTNIQIWSHDRNTLAQKWLLQSIIED